jgi:hypothetical protein
MSVFYRRQAVRATVLLLESAMALPDGADAEFADFLDRAERHLRVALALALPGEPTRKSEFVPDLDRFTPEGRER